MNDKAEIERPRSLRTVENDLGDPSMLKSLPREMMVRWEATALAISRFGMETAYCRTCGLALALHQPDEKAPELLLATCGECGTWYLLVVSREGTEALLFNLPVVELIRSTLAAEEEKSQGAKAKAMREKAAANGHGNHSAT